MFSSFSSAQLFDGFHFGISCLSAVLDGGADAGRTLRLPCQTYSLCRFAGQLLPTGEADCMTLLLCEQRQDRSCFS